MVDTVAIFVLGVFLPVAHIHIPQTTHEKLQTRYAVRTPSRKNLRQPTIHYVVLAVLELIIQIRLASNSRDLPASPFKRWD